MNNIGIKISEKGRDVQKGRTIFDTERPRLFCVKFGIGSYAFTGSSYGVGTVRIATIPHNFGYIPPAKAYLTDNNINYTYLPCFYDEHSDFLLSWITSTYIDCYCDKKNFYIDFIKRANIGNPPSDDTAWKNMAGITFNFKYYIFTNPLEEEE